MLQITIPGGEFFNNASQMFTYSKPQTLQLEHSLVSISKWESKWQKAFLSREQKTEEEFRDYVRCMTLTQNVDPEVYCNLTNENIRQIRAYMDNPMTATKLPQKPGRGGPTEVITSERVYSWMIALQIPVEYQKWHFNRLMTLIQLCNLNNEKSVPKNKKSRGDLYAQHRAINQANRARFHSAG